MRNVARWLLATLCLAGAAHAQKSPDAAQKSADATDKSTTAEATKGEEAKETDAENATEQAEPTPEEVERAGKHFERGLELYQEGEYALALIEFERAYDLVPDYRVQYNVGQVSIQVARYARALSALNNYLEDGGELIPEERRAEVEKDIEMLKGRTAKVAITSNIDGAEIVVDDLVIGTTPMDDPALLDAGVHRIEVRHTDYQTKRDQVTLAGGDSIDLSFELVPVEKPEVVVIEKPGERQPSPGPMRPQEQADFTVPTIAWMTTGALAVGAGVSGALGLAAKGELDQLKRSESEPAEREVAKQRAENRFLAADILTAAAVVSGGIALYLTLSASDSDDSDDTARGGRELRAVIGPTHVGVSGTF